MLASVGKAQAVALGKRLGNVHFDRIYSSDLERARATTALLLSQQQEQQQQATTVEGNVEPDHLMVDYTENLREMAQGHRELKPATMSLAMATRVAESAEAVSRHFNLLFICFPFFDRRLLSNALVVLFPYNERLISIGMNLCPMKKPMVNIWWNLWKMYNIAL